MAFYKHTIPTFEKMSTVLRLKRPASDYINVEKIVAEQERRMITQQALQSGKKVGRNDPCLCGSDKKFKQCCGRPA
ncbi:MAG: SEC-C domain-containing protein [Phycisphaeraceae bacterium]|nr:SEC-C domain-containing protein [Phycisphaeraceae bacterium]